jgi:hypothetical protein
MWVTSLAGIVGRSDKLIGYWQEPVTTWSINEESMRRELRWRTVVSARKIALRFGLFHKEQHHPRQRPLCQPAK